VVAIDQDLNIIARVKTGWAPRDLAVDPVRRMLLVGNYFTGTVTVIDLDTHTKLRQLHFGPLSPVHLLRGVETTPRQTWLISMDSGVWEYRPPLPTH